MIEVLGLKDIVPCVPLLMWVMSSTSCLSVQSCNLCGTSMRGCLLSCSAGATQWTCQYVCICSFSVSLKSWDQTYRIIILLAKHHLQRRVLNIIVQAEDKGIILCVYSCGRLIPSLSLSSSTFQACMYSLHMHVDPSTCIRCHRCGIYAQFTRKFRSSSIDSPLYASPTAALNCSASVAGRRENAAWKPSPCTAAHTPSFSFKNWLSLCVTTMSLSQSCCLLQHTQHRL